MFSRVELRVIKGRMKGNVTEIEWIESTYFK
jgi:hypothetical protein